MKTKFYRCPVCGNVVVKAVDSGVEVYCCGEPMEELQEQTKDAYFEKHLPVVTFKAPNTLHIKVGSIEHPMTPEHHIEFIYLESEHSGKIIWLNGKPEADVCVSDGKPLKIYAYCNLHGLWKLDVACPSCSK